MTGRARLVLRIVVSVGLLTLVAVLLDAREIAGRMVGLAPGWVAAALAVSVVQVVASAWRWRYTAARLGVRLPLGRAVREYYVATFLNQVLPGGVAGDVARAWRHAARSPRRGPAVSAVVLERLSGQAVMTGVAAVSAGALILTSPGIPRPGPGGMILLAVIFLAVALAARPMLRRLVRFPLLRGVASDAGRALLGRAFPVQAATSLGVVASYLIVYLMAARGVGVATPADTLIPLIAPVLITMLLPVTVAGWGIREGVAAALWASVGLAPADGVAISVAYGLLVLVSSLPGALWLTLSPLDSRSEPEDPDRTEGRLPAGSGAPGAGAPRPEYRSPGG